MSNIYRDVTLNQVSEQDIGKTIRVAGWVENIRDHGGIQFLDVRDHYGVVQVVVYDEAMLSDVAAALSADVSPVDSVRADSAFTELEDVTAVPHPPKAAMIQETD